MQSTLNNTTTIFENMAGVSSLFPLMYFANVYIGSSYPATSFSDYIEKETKAGGILEMSMLRQTYCTEKIVPAMFPKTTGDLSLCKKGCVKNYVAVI